MVDHSQSQPELLRRAQQRRRDYERVDSMTSITDRIPTLQTLLKNPESLLERIPPRAIMHVLVIAIIPLAMLASRIDVVNRDMDTTAVTTTISDDGDGFTVDVAPLTVDAVGTIGDNPLSESEDLPVPLSVVSRNQVLAPVVVPVTVTVDNAFMRNGPGTNYDPITRADAGLALQVIGKYGDWYQVRERVDTPVFWMAGELLSLPEDAPSTIFDLFDNEIPPPPPPRIAIVRESGLTMRDGPGTNYVAITTLKLNANVELIERYQDWYHIGSENNVDGWVRADFLEVTPDIAKRVITADSIPDPSPELVAIITGDTVNLRRGPDSRHAKLDTVAKGQRLDLIGKYKDWVQVSYNNKKAWVFRELLSVSSHVLRRVPTTSDFPALPVAPVKTKYTNISTSSDVANIALQYVGYRYVWGGTTPKSGFDCSGLMQYAFKQVGVDIPRIAASQFNASNGVQISGIENLAAGDLLFFTGFNSRGRRGITHVSMYLGNGKMVHAMNPSYGIQVSNFFDDYWLRHYYGAVRIRR
jgi:uncharacterized protein YgiM (DUF1202 family)